MALFFSPSTCGFYDSIVHANRIPEDARPITAEDHAALLASNSEGKEIVADASGNPIAVEPVPDEGELLRRLRNRRDQLLRDSDRTQIPDYPIPDDDRAAWAVYRQQLRDLPETLTDPATAVWPTPPAEEGAHA